jgi:hypothetical protein
MESRTDFMATQRLAARLLRDAMCGRNAGAATVLQSKMRQRTAKRQVQGRKTLKKRQNGAATVLQSRARQRNASKEYNEKRRARAEAIHAGA